MILSWAVEGAGENQDEDRVPVYDGCAEGARFGNIIGMIRVKLITASAEYRIHKSSLNRMILSPCSSCFYLSKVMFCAQKDELYTSI